jgi:dTDP-4-amino-4,6-dideoxygalactose transaminase
LERIDDFVKVRRAIARRYHGALEGRVRQVHPASLSPWQSYPVRLPAEADADIVLKRALALELELKRGYFQPLHRTARFSPYATGPLPVSDALASSVVCLPVYSDMQDELAGEVLRRFLVAAD